MKLYIEMTETELEQVNLVKFTGLEVGQRVSHVNAGKHGSGISSQLGTIIGHENRGLYFWGGLCVMVTVQWDDGESYDMVYTLAKKAV